MARDGRVPEHAVVPGRGRRPLGVLQVGLEHLVATFQPSPESCLATITRLLPQLASEVSHARHHHLCSPPCTHVLFSRALWLRGAWA